MSQWDVEYLNNNNNEAQIEIDGKFQRADVVAVANLARTKKVDRTNDSLVMRFNKITNSTTLASAASIFDRTVEVFDPTGISVGSYLIIFNASAVRVFNCVVTDLSLSPVLGIDRPVDFAFPAGSNLDVTTTYMNIDGSISEQVFGVRGPYAPTAIPEAVNLNALRLACIADTANVDLNHFGDLAALTNGMLLRKRVGADEYRNIFTVKSNGEILTAFGSWTPYLETNPVQGVNGFIATLHINGDENHGVAEHLGPGDDLELVFNEDLSGLLLLEAVAIVHDTEVL